MQGQTYTRLSLVPVTENDIFNLRTCYMSLDELFGFLRRFLLSSNFIRRQDRKILNLPAHPMLSHLT